MGKTEELINDILSAVSIYTEISISSILSKSKRAEVVDARHIAVMLMYKQGVYPGRIARVFGITTRNVNYVISTFGNRISTNRFMKNTYEILRKQIGNNAEVSEK